MEKIPSVAVIKEDLPFLDSASDYMMQGSWGI
jgi:hypothetical protein